MGKNRQKRKGVKIPLKQILEYQPQASQQVMDEVRYEVTRASVNLIVISDLSMNVFLYFTRSELMYNLRFVCNQWSQILQSDSFWGFYNQKHDEFTLVLNHVQRSLLWLDYLPRWSDMVIKWNFVRANARVRIIEETETEDHRFRATVKRKSQRTLSGPIIRVDFPSATTKNLRLPVLVNYDQDLQELQLFLPAKLYPDRYKAPFKIFNLWTMEDSAENSQMQPFHIPSDYKYVQCGSRIQYDTVHHVNEEIYRTIDTFIGSSTSDIGVVQMFLINLYLQVTTGNLLQSGRFMENPFEQRDTLDSVRPKIQRQLNKLHKIDLTIKRNHYKRTHLRLLMYQYDKETLRSLCEQIIASDSEKCLAAIIPRLDVTNSVEQILLTMKLTIQHGAIECFKHLHSFVDPSEYHTVDKLFSETKIVDKRSAKFINSYIQFAVDKELEPMQHFFTSMFSNEITFTTIAQVCLTLANQHVVYAKRLNLLEYLYDALANSAICDKEGLIYVLAAGSELDPKNFRSVANNQCDMNMVKLWHMNNRQRLLRDIQNFF